MILEVHGFSLPVGVEDGGSVTPEQRDHIGELPLLLERDDGKGATTAGLPVYREVLGVRLFSHPSASHFNHAKPASIRMRERKRECKRKQGDRNAAP